MRGGTVPSITPTGVALASGALALGVLGWALGYVVLCVVAAGGAVALAGGWVAALTVPRLDVERIVEPMRVERGHPARGVVAVRNPSRYRSRPCTAVDLVADQAIDVAIPALRPGRSVAVSYAIPTNRRGVLPVGPLSIGRQDPFGLWSSRRAVGDVATMLVQPRVHPLDPRPAGRTRHVEGPVSDRAPRGTQVFHSLREYTAGDDVRRVHWRSSARTGTLMVREHVDTSLPSTVVVLDTRAGQYRGDAFEEAVDVAASVLDSAQSRGFPARLVTTSGAVLTARAGQRGQHVRDFLTSVQVDDAGSLAQAAGNVLRGRDHDVLVVVAGARLDLADLGQITTMARRFATPALVTIDDADEPGMRWNAGLHLAGRSAAEALARWSTATVPGSRQAVSA